MQNSKKKKKNPNDYGFKRTVRSYTHQMEGMRPQLLKGSTASTMDGEMHEQET